MSTLRFLQPAAIADAQFGSSNVAEADYPVWSAGTTYAADDRVINLSTHKVYQSVQAGAGHDPALDDGTWWVEVGNTNRWKMFDASVGSITQNAGSIDVTVYPGRADAIALLDIAGSSVQITITNEAVVVYDQTFTIGDGTVLSDWWEYFFVDPSPRTVLIADGLPGYPSAVARVVISGTACKCGTLAIGPMVEVGRVRVGARVGIIDYSRKETSDFGVTSVVERSYARRMDLDVVVPSGRLDYLTEKLAAQRAKPAVWIADNDHSSLVIYGWAKDWGVVIPGPVVLEASITIEGLI